MFKEYDVIPEGLLDCDASQLHKKLGGPALIHLQGRQEPCIFISVLMHGNESTGWDAIRLVLKKFVDKKLPRAMSLFIGNTLAAEQGLRHLPDQPDYNRVWPDSDAADCPEKHMMLDVVNIMRQRQCFASVDVHNNTGLNPHYACLNELKPQVMHLAAMFSRTVVYFIRPQGVQSIAMSKLCPSVTLECGKSGQQSGAKHAAEYIEACLHLVEHPVHPIAKHDIDIYHTVAIVKVKEGMTFSVASNNASKDDLILNREIDHLNFCELDAGTVFGKVASVEMPIEVIDEAGNDKSTVYFQVTANKLVSHVEFMPSMLTRDTDIIRQDCMCYLMERYDVG